MQALLDEAVEALRRKRFLEATNDAFARLRKNGAAWTAVEGERRAWDATLLDGITVHERGPDHGPRRRKPRARR